MKNNGLLNLRNWFSNYLIDSGCRFCWPCSCLFSLWTELVTRSKVTGKFWTSSLHTSHFLSPFVLNHLTKHSSCTNLRSPLQLHSILKVFLSSHTSKHILHTASSSGISSSAVTSTCTGVIWSDWPSIESSYKIKMWYMLTCKVK